MQQEPITKERGLPYLSKAPKIDIKMLEKTGLDKALPFTVPLERNYH